MVKTSMVMGMRMEGMIPIIRMMTRLAMMKMVVIMFRFCG